MLDNLRLALLISLSILLVVVLYKRFKRAVMMRERPAPMHAELLHVEVMYHPARLRVHLSVPSDQEIHPAMLSEAHAPLRRWPAQQVAAGQHVLELELDGHGDGAYYFELATATQRTERRFKLRFA